MRMAIFENVMGNRIAVHPSQAFIETDDGTVPWLYNTARGERANCLNMTFDEAVEELERAMVEEPRHVAKRMIDAIEKQREELLQDRVR